MTAAAWPVPDAAGPGTDDGSGPDEGVAVEIMQRTCSGSTAGVLS